VAVAQGVAHSQRPAAAACLVRLGLDVGVVRDWYGLDSIGAAPIAASSVNSDDGIEEEEDDDDETELDEDDEDEAELDLNMMASVD
tara:strand:- start:220 stop:477 length:258 start_codon:yes stop_codon:yes gene_type:complete